MPKEMMRALLPFYVKYVKNVYCPIGAKDLLNTGSIYKLKASSYIEEKSGLMESVELA